PLVSGENFICLRCFMSLARGQRETSGENDVWSKFVVFPEVTSARSFMSFEGNGPARKLVHAFKYDGQCALAYFLGKLMAGESEDFYRQSAWDYIIPVPLHRSRLRERGYNQSEFMARGFGDTLGIPVEAELLTRFRKTKTQTGKDKLARWKSTAEMYAIAENANLVGKNILVLDDVVTTGATVSGIIEILINSKVNTIGVVSFAGE
ncbi:MAG: ComF family protein, partial [Cyclobacteriaceae bacterium]